MRNPAVLRGLCRALAHSEHSARTLWSSAILNTLSKQKMKLYGVLWVMSKQSLPCLWCLKCDWNTVMKSNCVRQLPLLPEEVAEKNRVRKWVYFDGWLDIHMGEATSRKDVFGIMGRLDRQSMEFSFPPLFFQHPSASLLTGQRSIGIFRK